MVLPVGIVGVAILGINWWPILAHNIYMFSHQIPYRGRNWTMLSLVTSGLESEAWFEGHRYFSHYLNLMPISHFKFFHPSGQGGQLSL